MTVSPFIFPELFRLGEAKARGFRLVSFGFLARILVPGRKWKMLSSLETLS